MKLYKTLREVAWWVLLAAAISGCGGGGGSGPGEPEPGNGLEYLKDVPLAIQATGSTLTTQIDVVGGAPLHLVLDASSVRAEGWTLAGAMPDPDNPGEYLFQEPPQELPEERTYRGAVIGLPDSVVLGTSDGSSLSATIALGNGLSYMVTPTEGASSLDGQTPHALYEMTSPSFPTFGGGSPGDFAVVELAIDADWDFFAKRNFSVQEMVEDIERTIDCASFIFERELGIRFEIVWISYWPYEPDPYYSLNTKDLVHGFQDFWNGYMGFVHRDVALLLSGKSMDKFGASINPYIGYVCDIYNAYAVSSAQYAPANSPQESFELIKSVAHEIGHVFSAEHCDGQPDCGIMCGCNLQFGSSARFEILSHLATRVCLDYESPPLSGDLPDLRIVPEIDPFLGLGCQHVVKLTVFNDGPGSVDADHVRMATWLSLDGDVDNFNGDDIPMGAPSDPLDPFGGVSIRLDPGESTSFTFLSLPVPGNAAIGQQHFVARVDVGGGPCATVCEEDEGNNDHDLPVQVQGMSAGVVSLSYSGPLYSGHLVPVQVEVRNSHFGVLDVPFLLTFGINSVQGWVYDVPPGGSKTASVTILVPPSELDCGDPDPFSMTGCTTLAVDLNPFDNCFTLFGLPVEDPFWDLKVEIVSAPSSAKLWQNVSWKARWTNVGTTRSSQVCMRSGISLFAGDPFNWNSGFIFNNCGPGPLQFHTVPELDPGDTHEWTFSMCIHPGASVQTQYLKVGVDWFSGCYDYCNAGKNFDERTISITP